MSMHIVDHTTCVACTMRLIVHLGWLDYTHVRDLASTFHFHHSMHHDIYALCVASNSWITCSYHMFGCNNVITSHMPCPIDCYMLVLISSHMMNNSSFYCVECHTIFTTPYACYAWIVLHLTHVFRHFISLVLWMIPMPTIDLSLSALPMFAMTLRYMLIILSHIFASLPHISMLVPMISLLVLNLCAYMPCHTPLSHHMLCMMTTLVWWITSWMLGFALMPTTFVFPRACYLCSFWRNQKTVQHWRVTISSFHMTSA